jgi:uncharacterized membrane-anchored protein
MVAMRLLTRFRRGPAGEPGVLSGPVRLDLRTKRLAGRLNPGDVAVIDHVDLDRVAAESLLAARVAAVLNAKPSISGRYPNLGPELLVAAGVPLIDDLGDDLFQHVREDDIVTIDGATVYVDGAPVAHGIRQDADTVAKAMADSREGLSVQLEAFAANTMEYLKSERDLLIDGVGVPTIATRIAGRHCLIVVRGYNYRADLDALRSYIREFKPVLIGVDGGADALLEAGYRPDLVVGDMDSVSDRALRVAGELVVHAYPDGRAPGVERLRLLNLPAVPFAAAATSEDIAMLLADEKGASLIVAVGTHGTLVEFLDKGRSGMASTFLTRLRVGGKLVDAKGVSRLYRQTTSLPALVLLAVSVVGAMAAGVAVSTVGRSGLTVLSHWWDALMTQLQRLIS